MAKIGSFGKVVFQVSDSCVLRPTSIARSGSATWADHDLIRSKPKGEFLHADPRKVDIDVSIYAQLGVKPSEMLDLLYSYCEKGKLYPLVIGSKAMSKYNMAIKSISDTWDTIIKDGYLAGVSVSLSFEEVR
jgi:hypothetical protein